MKADRRTLNKGEGDGGRSITPTFQGENKVFVSNKVRSTRYTAWNFLPKATLIQFAKVQNVFYTIGAVLQSIPSISTNDPLATIIPLAYVILVGVLKEFIADYKRAKADKKVNMQTVSLVHSRDG